MMKINGISENSNMQAGLSMTTDSVSKNIQNQIANAQKKLQDISSNEDMAIEEKMKKRQEIQQEITALNQQLRQHQIEKRKEQQESAAPAETLTGGAGKTNTARNSEKSSGLSQASMQAMLSADGSMKQAKVQGSIATKMEGRAGILESEIKLDSQRGMVTQKKEEELADMQQKARAATASQVSMLAQAGETIQEAAKTDRQNGDDEANSEADTNEKTEKSIETEYIPVDVYL